MSGSLELSSVHLFTSSDLLLLLSDLPAMETRALALNCAAGVSMEYDFVLSLLLNPKALFSHFDLALLLPVFKVQLIAGEQKKLALCFISTTRC